MIKGSAALAACLGLAATGYAAANALEPLLLDGVAGLSCTANLLSVTCVYPAGERAEPLLYAVLAAAAGATLIGMRLWASENPLYPFAMFVAGLGALAMAYDTAFALPLLNEGKLIDDTMNTLSLVIFASFCMVFMLAARQGLSLPRVAAAVAVSYGVKLAAMAAFAVIQPGLIGATKLFALYGLYTWGVFNIHLMALTFVLAPRRTDAAPTEAAS